MGLKKSLSVGELPLDIILNRFNISVNLLAHESGVFIGKIIYLKRSGKIVIMAKVIGRYLQVVVKALMVFGCFQWNRS